MKKKLTYKFHIKSGDLVKLISGKEKGKVGIVKKLLKRDSTIIIKDINKKYKHIKKSGKRSQSGEIKQFEFPIHSSNVIKWNE